MGGSISEKPKSHEGRANRRCDIVAESGQVLVVLALLVPVLLGLAGLALDTGILTQNRTEGQRAADAAALAGAERIVFHLPGESTADIENNARQVACQYAQKNGFGTGSCPNSEVTVNLPPLSGPHAGDHDFVEVIITRTSPTYFMKVLGIDSTTITTRAVGVSTPEKRNYALVVLSPHQCDAFTTSSNIVINGGGIVVDSDGAAGGSCVGESASQNGGSVITSQSCYDKAGDLIDCTLDYNEESSWAVANNVTDIPSPTKAPPFPDPLSCPDGSQATIANGGPDDYCPRPVPCTDLSSAVPSVCVPISTTACGNHSIPCNSNQLSTAASPKVTHLTGSGDVTLEPGTYYGGLDINSTSQTVHFKPGIYVFAGTQQNGNGGGLSYQSGNLCGVGAAGTCTVATGVTFFNTQNVAGGLPCGSMKLTGSGYFKFNAPTVPHSAVLTGYYEMLIWQDDSCTAQFTFAGSGNGGAWTETGMMYLPQADMKVTGGGNFGAVQIITRTFSQSGGQSITIDFTRYVDTDDRTYKLVE